MTVLFRFGGMHDEYSLEMYKKMTQNIPEIIVEEPKKKADSKKKDSKKKDSKKKDSKKKDSKKKGKVSLNGLQKIAKSKKISIYKKGKGNKYTKIPLTVSGLKTRLTRNKVKY